MASGPPATGSCHTIVRYGVDCWHGPGRAGRDTRDAQRAGAARRARGADVGALVPLDECAVRRGGTRDAYVGST